MKHQLLSISLTAIFLSLAAGSIPNHNSRPSLEQSVSHFISPLKAQALTVEDVPNSREMNGGWVTDMANILDQHTERELNHLITQLEAVNGTEIAVVTVPETQPSATPKQFTTELFNHWGIGKQGEDNGILFLISVGDRRVEIETGYGIEPILPDAKVGQIIENKITPQFKKGYYNLGTLEGTEALISELQGDSLIIQPEQLSPTSIEPLSPTITEDSSDDRIPWIFILFTGGGFLIIVGSMTLIHLLKKLRKANHDNTYYKYEVTELNDKLRSLEHELKNLKDNKPVFIKPSGYTKKLPDTNNGHRPLHCSECREALQRIDNQNLQSYLREPQKISKKFKTAKFQGWGCFNCNLKNPKLGIHIFREKLPSHQYEECPKCQEFTVTEKIEKISSPTYSKKGKTSITQSCHACNYHKEIIKEIPCIHRPASHSSHSSSSHSSSSSSSSGSYSSGSYSSGSYSGGSSSSSSSSYGDGSSGGGGAGGGW
ncbi:TPM domain-containing protein [Crocosphaera sp.]|uniref:TPM domain-containing protein n=1 Tax=Crocosphaera sp. TaxID=2729996 RepID=UPI003F27E99A